MYVLIINYSDIDIDDKFFMKVKKGSEEMHYYICLVNI